jgi:hypothetical protein
MRYNTQDLPEYIIPPDVMHAPAKIFGLTLFQLFVFMVASVIALAFIFYCPLISGILLLQIVLGGLVWGGVVAFFLLQAPHLTPFEQLLNYLAFRRSPIPRQTRARPLPLTEGVRPTLVSKGAGAAHQEKSSGEVD